MISENDFNRGVVLRLLDAGVDINARTDWGDTAAHYAALHGTYEVLKLLCEEGIYVDKPKDCKYLLPVLYSTKFKNNLPRTFL